MSTLESVFFFAAMATLIVTIVTSIWHILMIRRTSSKETPEKYSRLMQKVILMLTLTAFVFLSADIASRAIITGHGPFSSMFEFAIAFAWGITGIGLFYWWRYRITLISSMSSTVAAIFLIYASTLPSRAGQLVPALQQSFLLSTHVTAAVIAYGAFCIGFVAAILFLIQQKRHSPLLPSVKVLDDLSYHTVMIGFPFLSLTIILGAIWADIAWGNYWSWDPKETASLVTWLFYVSYLHTRLVGRWKGSRSAIILIVAFAAVIYTLFGNYIFSGLHSYA